MSHCTYSTSKKKKRYGYNAYTPNGEWDDVAERMLRSFTEGGHPVFRGTIALERGTLRSKGGAKLSMHFCGDPPTVKVVSRPITSLNQFSIYGVAVDMCEELASRISGYLVGTVKLVAENKPETMVSQPCLSATTNPLLTSDWARGNLLREDKQRFANLPNDLRIISVLKTVVRGQYFPTVDEAERQN